MKTKVNVAKGKAAVKRELNPIMKFEVLEGHHYHGDKVWTKGETVPSRFDLEKMFRGKFKRVPDEVPADEGHEDFRYEIPGMDTGRVATTKGGRQVSKNPEGDEPEVVSGDPFPERVEESQHQFLVGAVDVTDEFPFVKEEAQGLKVLKNGKNYSVVSEDSPRELLNQNRPLRKKDVIPFVEKFLDGELDEESEDEGEEDEE